jgi:hypothetical protein
MAWAAWGFPRCSEHARASYKITDINAGTIIFRHSGEQTAIVGQIDRVTGDLEATITDYLDVQKREISTESRYEMKCRPAQRMF